MSQLTKNNKPIIPVFFASDDNYVPFLAVSIKSLLDNASNDYYYNIYILTEGISQTNEERLKKYATENSEIIFVDLSKNIAKIRDRLSSTLRDYYTESIFYRIFILAFYFITIHNAPSTFFEYYASKTCILCKKGLLI